MTLQTEEHPASGLRLNVSGATSVSVHGGRAAGSAAVEAGAAGESAERGAAELQRQWARLDDVMRSIADPASQEGAIARRAFERLTVLTSDLQLDMSVMELAHQVPRGPRVPPLPPPPRAPLTRHVEPQIISCTSPACTHC